MFVIRQLPNIVNHSDFENKAIWIIPIKSTRIYIYQPTMMEVFTVTISTVNVTYGAAPQAPGPPHYADELKLANKVVLSTILAFIMVAMGCVISIEDIKTTVSVYPDSFNIYILIVFVFVCLSWRVVIYFFIQKA